MRPYLRAANVTWDGLDLSDVKEMDFSEGEVARYRLEPGDVLVNEASGSATEVGKPARWRGEIADCCFQNTLIRVRPRDGLDSRFVEHRIRYEALRGGFARGSRGVGIHHLSAATLAEWPIEVPPLAQQRHLVERLDQMHSHLETGIAALQRVQRVLERLREVILDAAVRGQLLNQNQEDEPAEVLLKRILEDRRTTWEQEQHHRAAAKGKTLTGQAWKQRYKPPGEVAHAGLPKLPERWVWTSLDAVADVRLGRQRSPKDHHGTHMRPYLRAANVTWCGLDLSDVKEMNFTDAEAAVYRLQPGDIVVNEASGSPQEVGKPAMWRDELDECCFQNTLVRVRARGVEPRYLEHWIRHQALRGSFAVGSRGVGIHHLTAGALAGWPVPLPPREEQDRIVAEVDRCLSFVGSAEHAVDRGLERAETLRRSLLHAAFTGRLTGGAHPEESPGVAMPVSTEATTEAS
jgi:type I restriction enzyme S subunit